ncbi:MAG: AMP-binding protein, partial [Burkholderiales bacterium]
GPNVFAGYLDPASDRGVLLEAGWLNTGDLGRLDRDGYLYLTGRSKDVIIRGGHNIDPQAIEDVLYGHPAVALAAAVGRPDAYAGELPVAFVTLRPGAPESGESLREYARERVPERPAAPVEVIVLQQMPLTGVGKIYKPALRDEITRRVVVAALARAGLVGIEVAVREDKRLGRVVRLNPPRHREGSLPAERAEGDSESGRTRALDPGADASDALEVLRERIDEALRGLPLQIELHARTAS